MATSPLQAESARANPAPLSLHCAATAFEEIETDLAELSARAIVARLDGLAAVAAKHSDAFLDASRAARAAMQ